MSWLLWTVLWWTQGCVYLLGAQLCLGMCPGVGFLDHATTLVLVFWGPSILISVMAALVYISTNTVGGFPFLHALSRVVVCRLFNEGRSDWCEVAPHCSFDLHVSNNLWCWGSFPVPVGLLYVVLEKYLLRSPAHFSVGLFDILLLFS